jgi:hypothetical protein
VLNKQLLAAMGGDLTRAPPFAQANDVLKNATGGATGMRCVATGHNRRRWPPGCLDAHSLQGALSRSHLEFPAACFRTS